MNQPMQLQIGTEEVYMIIGELEVVRRKLNQQVQTLLIQVNEMNAEIERLRAENGRLGKTDSIE